MTGYTWLDGEWGDILGSHLAKNDVNPASHPTAIDLCAGDGSIARILVDLGWNPDDITCIDLHRSRNPLVTDVRWLHWDLEALLETINDSGPLPGVVEGYKGYFDIAILAQGNMGIGMTGINTLLQFFVR